MTEIINTKKRDYQYNGPVESSDYNSRIEENYKDLVFLYNKANVLDSKLAQAFERVIKDQKFLSMAVSDMEDRIKALEAANNSISIHSYSQLDYASFVGTEFAISGTQLLHFDPVYNLITLPKVNSGSYSKVKFGNTQQGQIIVDFFKAKIQQDATSIDAPGAIIDSTPIYNCILDSVDKVWKRNIISDTASAAGARMTLYVEVPSDVSGSLKTNMIKLNPYPSFGVDITSIEYTQKPNPTMTDSDGWRPLNYRAYYDGQTDAIGKVAPGGWSTAGADAVLNSGPLVFIFPDTEITAVRVNFRQRSYFTELGKFIYTYGLSDFDIRYDKYLESGKMIVKYTAPAGQTINEITSVTPKIYNVPLSLISTAFSYRVIYNDSGSYSLTNPGASNHVWIEVTLNMLDDKTSPILTDLIIQYQ